MAGLGIKDPWDLVAVARVAGVVCFSKRLRMFDFPAIAATTPPDFGARLTEVQRMLGPQAEPCATWLNNGAIGDVQPEHTRQKWWTGQWHEARSNLLGANGSVRDQCRLQLQRMQHTHAFMLRVPNQGLHNTFSGPEYRLLLRFWLGKPLASNVPRRPCPC